MTFLAARLLYPELPGTRPSMLCDRILSASTLNVSYYCTHFVHLIHRTSTSRVFVHWDESRITMHNRQVKIRVLSFDRENWTRTASQREHLQNKSYVAGILKNWHSGRPQWYREASPIISQGIQLFPFRHVIWIAQILLEKFILRTLRTLIRIKAEAHWGTRSLVAAIVFLGSYYPDIKVYPLCRYFGKRQTQKRHPRMNGLSGVQYTHQSRAKGLEEWRVC